MYLADGSCHVPTPTRPISAAVTEDWRRHYYAAVSWIDHQVGRVLGTLTEIGLEEETIVIFHGDHGWQLGVSAALFFFHRRD